MRCSPPPVRLLDQGTWARWKEPTEDERLDQRFAVPIPRRDLLIGPATNAGADDLESTRPHSRGRLSVADDRMAAVVNDV